MTISIPTGLTAGGLTAGSQTGAASCGSPFDVTPSPDDSGFADQLSKAQQQVSPQSSQSTSQATHASSQQPTPAPTGEKEPADQTDSDEQNSSAQPTRSNLPAKPTDSTDQSEQPQVEDQVALAHEMAAAQPGPSPLAKDDSKPVLDKKDKTVTKTSAPETSDAQQPTTDAQMNVVQPVTNQKDDSNAQPSSDEAAAQAAALGAGGQPNQPMAAGDQNATPGKTADGAVAKVQVSPFKQSATTDTNDEDQDSAAAATANAPAAAAADQKSKVATAIAADAQADATAGSTQAPTVSPNHATPAVAATPAPIATREAQFAQANQTNIVTGIKGELLPHGGTMQIRLDPPELGTMQVTVKMQDGAVWASFQTTNDDATRMLTHNLSQLKDALESAGMSVERLHVHQASKSETSGGGEDSGQQSSNTDERTARQEQQRREMLRRMWARMANNGEDPLDLVA